MRDILLFGPQSAGKTQLVRSLMGEKYDEPDQTGIKEYSVYKYGLIGKITRYFPLGKMLLGEKTTIKINEIGGKYTYLTDKKFLHSKFKSNNKLLFVFNGNDFITELKNYQEGGNISSILRCYVMPALLEKEESEDRELKRDIRFIATHSDDYKGEEDMKAAIFSCIGKANEEYASYGMRYTFLPLIRGNLFCVNATDSIEVSKLFRGIINEL